MNDWGIKLSVEGKYQEAIGKFDEAIQCSVNDAMRNKVEHCKNLALQESKKELIQQLDHLRIGHRLEDVNHEIMHEINDMQDHRNWIKSRSEIYYYDCGDMVEVPRSEYFFSWNDTKDGWIPDIRFNGVLFEHDSSMADCGLYNAKINKAIILDILDRKLSYKIRSNEQYQESIKKFNTACDSSVSSEGKAMYQNNMANALKDLANELRSQKLNDDAVIKFKEAVTKYAEACDVKVNEKHKAIYQNNKALALNDWGNVLKDLANKLHNQKLHTDAVIKFNEDFTKHKDLANKLRSQKLHTDALEKYKEAVTKYAEALSRATKDSTKDIVRNDKAAMLNDWANELGSQKLYDEAKSKLLEALSIAKSENTKNESKKSLIQILNKVIKSPVNATSQETGQNTDESNRDSVQLVDVKNCNTQVEKLGGARYNLDNALDDSTKIEVIDESVMKSLTQDEKVSTEEIEGGGGG